MLSRRVGDIHFHERAHDSGECADREKKTRLHLARSFFILESDLRCDAAKNRAFSPRIIGRCSFCKKNEKKKNTHCVRGVQCALDVFDRDYAAQNVLCAGNEEFFIARMIEIIAVFESDKPPRSIISRDWTRSAVYPMTIWINGPDPSVWRDLPQITWNCSRSVIYINRD